jgi:Domain of unknown function (DUF5666)
MNNIRFVAVAITSALALGFTSCNQAPVSTGSAQLVSGPITALSASSLTVNGKTFSLNSAAAKSRSKAETNVSVNGNAAKPGALSVGEHVTVKADGTDATEVDIDLELKGAIVSLDSVNNSLVVAGTTVIVSSATRIDLSGDDDKASSSAHTLADLFALPVGTFVEVTGTTDATTGNVTASKIEVKNKTERGEDGEDDETEIKGAVLGLTANSFTLGAVTVNCNAPCTLPTGLKNGDFVEAEGALDTAGTILTASKVKTEGESHHATAGSSVVLDHKIRAIDTTAKTFRIEEFTVDYSSITPAPTLADKDRVKVEGTVDATNVKLIHATSITVLPANEPKDDGSHGDHGGHGSNGGVAGPGGNPENPGK